MWLFGGFLLATDAPSPSGVSDQLILMVGGVITAAIVALGGVLVAIVNSRANKTTTPSPPAASPTANEHVLYERTAVLSQRADDNDDRDDVQDRRLDKFERWAEHHDPEWWGH